MIIRPTIAVLATAVLLSSTTAAQAGIYKCVINSAVNGMGGKLVPMPATDGFVKAHDPVIINTTTGFIRTGKPSSKDTDWETTLRGEEVGQRRGWDWQFVRKLPQRLHPFKPERGTVHEVIKLRLWPYDLDHKPSGPRFSYFTEGYFFAGTCTEIS